jgi:hypothetical protein
MARKMRIAATAVIKAQYGQSSEQIAHDVVEAIVGALSPPGDYVQALTEICRLRTELERTVNQRDAAERTVLRIADRAPDRIADRAPDRSSEAIAIALGHADRAAANLGHVITELRREFGS